MKPASVRRGSEPHHMSRLRIGIAGHRFDGFLPGRQDLAGASIDVVAAVPDRRPVHTDGSAAARPPHMHVGGQSPGAAAAAEIAPTERRMQMRAGRCWGSMAAKY